MDANGISVVPTLCNYERINGDTTSLARCYFRMEKERAFAKTFWHMQSPVFPTLDSFLRYFEYYSSNSIHRIATPEQETIGYFFIYDLVVPSHCNVGGFVCRKFWGEAPESIGEWLLSELHVKMGVERVYAFTPWQTAASLCERIGMRQCGAIEAYAKGVDVRVYVHEGEVCQVAVADK